MESDRKMELDVYLPKQRLALEYQGQQHFYDIYALGNLWTQKQKDEEKRMACKAHGITLIEIPYWWDFGKSSLEATIQIHRPDLIHSSQGEPIPNEPLKKFPKGNVLRFWFI
jgi:hypothetical protein